MRRHGPGTEGKRPVARFEKAGGERSASGGGGRPECGRAGRPPRAAATDLATHASGAFQTKRRRLRRAVPVSSRGTVAIAPSAVARPRAGRTGRVGGELKRLEHYGTFLRTLPCGVLALALGSPAGFACRPGPNHRARLRRRWPRGSPPPWRASGSATPGTRRSSASSARARHGRRVCASGGAGGATPLPAPGSTVRVGLLGCSAA